MVIVPAQRGGRKACALHVDRRLSLVLFVFAGKPSLHVSRDTQDCRVLV